MASFPVAKRGCRGYLPARGVQPRAFSCAGRVQRTPRPTMAVPSRSLERRNLRPHSGLDSAVTTDSEAEPDQQRLVFKPRRQNDTNLEQSILFAFCPFCEMRAATLRLVSRLLGLGLMCCCATSSGSSSSTPLTEGPAALLVVNPSPGIF